MFQRGLTKLLIFIIVCITCSSYFFWGKYNVFEYYKLKKEILLEEQQIKDLEQQMNKLQAKIDKWKSDEFYTEKFARQNLQMGKPNEQVFVQTNTDEKV